MSRLQAQHSIDSFNFAHHKSRQQARLRILKLLDLDFLLNPASSDSLLALFVVTAESIPVPARAQQAGSSA